MAADKTFGIIGSCSS